jgi:REP element-mobilizing transposase RayT
MILNNAGQIVNECWLDIPNHFPNVQLHEYVIMPNHIHGIIEFVGANNYSPENHSIIGAKNLSPENHSPENHSIIGAKNLLPENHSPKNHSIIGAKNLSPLRSPSKTIGSVVRGFKIGVTKWMRQNTNVYNVFQRNYYEHIIQNDQSYQNISEYIINNPTKWNDDKFYLL